MTEKIIIKDSTCELCSDPEYWGIFDNFYEYYSCPKCGRVIHPNVGDYIESCSEDYEDYYE